MCWAVIVTVIATVVVIAAVAVVVAVIVPFRVVMPVAVRMLVAMPVIAAWAVHMASLSGPDGDGHATGDSGLHMAVRRGFGVGMFMPVVMVVVVTVAVPMVMAVAVTASMFVAVAMAMAARVGARFGFERGLRLRDDQVHALQHLAQHVIGLDLEVVGLQFDLHMPIAQVVGRTSQVEGAAMLRAGAHHHHRLRRRVHTHQGAIFGHQHIPTTHHAAAWQKHPQAPTHGVDGLEPALLAGVPVQADGGRPLEQHRGQAATSGHEFVDGDHLQGLQEGEREEWTQEVCAGKV
jgi:hypothetical protein